ncbi:hypothetical protein AFR_23725 [Actinoplanes friuliensis DSM 7358]|uniref:Uncharacterized protein n=1 Tax=Actinoplanes friuliensis DSM 7358 TaxID=1246995 RepID=U5W183_9ACTN|nr:hypothetical protein AFR_23725 [Actinoplanes friuliensis DSM 7358]
MLKRQITVGSNPDSRHRRVARSDMYESATSKVQCWSAQASTATDSWAVSGWSGGRTSTIESSAIGTRSMAGSSSVPAKSVVVMMTSTSPRRRAGMLSWGSSSSRTTDRSGWRSARRATAGSARACTALWKAASVTVPAGSSASPRSSASAASIAARISRARAASRTPAAVSRTLLPVRSSSAVRVSRSSVASCCDTADGLSRPRCATARTVPWVARSASSRSRHGLRVTPRLYGYA